jgi:hypothetical protein
MTTRRFPAFARALLAPEPMFGLAIVTICWVSLSYFIAVERNNMINAAIQGGTMRLDSPSESAAELSDRPRRAIQAAKRSGPH